MPVLMLDTDIPQRSRDRPIASILYVRGRDAPHPEIVLVGGGAPCTLGTPRGGHERATSRLWLGRASGS